MIQDRKIINLAKPITELADRPALSAADLKEYFDGNAEQIKTSFNGVIDDLGALGDESGASNIGYKKHTHGNSYSVQGSVDELYDNTYTMAQSISTETTNRTNADTTLQNNINSEISARQSADNELSADITESHDNLQGQIDTMGTTFGNDIADLQANKADLADGKVPASQLPSFVDDVIEVNTFADLPATGESGKIYVTKDTNKTYRWSGSAYVEISQSLALGETSSTAYAGDKGKQTTDNLAALSTDVNDMYIEFGSGILSLQEQIDEEADIRQGADEYLESAISSEASARTAADNILDNKIDAKGYMQKASLTINTDYITGVAYTTSTQTFTKVGHGLTNGTPVQLSFDTGGALPAGYTPFNKPSSPIVHGKFIGWVYNATAATFQIVPTHSSTTPVPTTTDGSNLKVRVAGVNTGAAAQIAGLDGNTDGGYIYEAMGVLARPSGTQSTPSITVNGLTTSGFYYSKKQPSVQGAHALYGSGFGASNSFLDFSLDAKFNQFTTTKIKINTEFECANTADFTTFVPVEVFCAKGKCEDINGTGTTANITSIEFVGGTNYLLNDSKIIVYKMN